MDLGEEEEELEVEDYSSDQSDPSIGEVQTFCIDREGGQSIGVLPDTHTSTHQYLDDSKHPQLPMKVSSCTQQCIQFSKITIMFSQSTPPSCSREEELDKMTSCEVAEERRKVRIERAAIIEQSRVS